MPFAKGSSIHNFSIRTRAYPSLQAVNNAGDALIINPAAAATLSAMPAVTFTAIQHHCPLASTKLYCLVTKQATLFKFSQLQNERIMLTQVLTEVSQSLGIHTLAALTKSTEVWFQAS